MQKRLAFHAWEEAGGGGGWFLPFTKDVIGICSRQPVRSSGVEERRRGGGAAGELVSLRVLTTSYLWWAVLVVEGDGGCLGSGSRLRYAHFSWRDGG